MTIFFKRWVIWTSVGATGPQPTVNLPVVVGFVVCITAMPNVGHMLQASACRCNTGTTCTTKLFSLPDAVIDDRFRPASAPGLQKKSLYESPSKYSVLCVRSIFHLHLRLNLR